MRDFPYMHLDKTGLAQSKSTKRVCRFIPGFHYVPWLVLWFIALLILSNVILPSHRNTAYAEQKDNNRWDNVTAWKGTVSITGAYQGSASIYDEVTFQNSMSGSVNLSGYGFMGSGVWTGYIIGSYSIYEKKVIYDFRDCDGDGNRTDDEISTEKGGGSTTDWTFNLKFFNDEMYNLEFGEWVAVEDTWETCSTYTSGNNSNVFFLYPDETLVNIPLPESGLILSGSKKYGIYEYSDLTVDYEVTWNLEPVTESPEKNSCIVVACTIAVQNQSLGETVDIAGTPFSLNYQSERVEGRSGANSLAISHD